MSGSGLQFFLAFVIVLVLIGAAAWFARRFASSRLGNNANRGRMPRLAVIDAAAVDGRRRLVLVRRDNVEHLLMIGGPSDIVVEPNIVRATPSREQMPPRTAEPGWVESDAPRAESLDHERTPPLPEMPPPPRAQRPSFPEELRRAAPPPPPPAPERRPPATDPLAGFAPEPLSRHDTAPSREPSMREPAMREPRPMPRTEPMMPRATRPIEPPKAAPPVRPVAERSPLPPDADKNLADMAKRLEETLRRPTPAEDAIAPPVAPDTPAPRPAPAPRDEAKPASADPKAPFKSLEDEMASLLGRPKSPS